jgi:hypothetical protein
MKPEQMAEALEGAAEQLHVRVRYEPLNVGDVKSPGGLCRVHRDWWVLIDKKASAPERVAILCDALSRFDTDAVFLPPKVRQAVHARREAAQS